MLDPHSEAQAKWGLELLDIWGIMQTENHKLSYVNTQIYLFNEDWSESPIGENLHSNICRKSNLIVGVGDGIISSYRFYFWQSVD